MIGRFKNYRAYKKEEKALAKELATAVYLALGFTKNGSRVTANQIPTFENGRTVIETCDIHSQTIRRDSVGCGIGGQLGPHNMYAFFDQLPYSIKLSEEPFDERQKGIFSEIQGDYQPKFTALYNKYYENKREK